ncbi:MAG TPA: hypothetical protein VE621_23830, partial [Bryobacteraceae bacterium]|nr:hypothetical protein [Bryobacteraceae bacterium]
MSAQPAKQTVSSSANNYEVCILRLGGFCDEPADVTGADADFCRDPFGFQELGQMISGSFNQIGLEINIEVRLRPGLNGWNCVRDSQSCIQS